MRRYVVILVALLVMIVFVNVLMWRGLGGFQQNGAELLQQAVTGTVIIDGVPFEMKDIVAGKMPDVAGGMPADVKRDLTSGMFAGMSEPSLEMRENVDFLLSPAILVQQCISEGVVITYPEE